VGTMATFLFANYGSVTLDQSMANDSGADLAAGYGIVLQEPHGSSNATAATRSESYSCRAATRS
jgi:hypothetical protein